MMASPESPPKLNIVIVGGGLIGPRHAASVTKNPSTHLLALIDPAPHGPSTAKSLHTLHFPSISALLAADTEKPDAAIICTPNNTHVPLALSLISAGIHVLVEKPISTSIPEGLQLIRAAKDKGVKVLVGHHRRFNPYLLSAKQALIEKKLGQVIAVQGSWCLRKPDAYFDGIGSWRRSATSGGVVLINLIHEVDLLQYLLGPVTLVSALPTSKTRDFDAEEGAAILIKFESGVVGTFVLSDACPSPWNFEAGTGENPTIPHVDGESGAGGFYRILGTKGGLSVPDLTIWKGEWNDVLEKEELRVHKEEVPFDLQVQHLVDVIEGREEPRCTGEEALSAMVVCEGVKMAMESGEWVEIRGFEVLVCGGAGGK